LFSGKYLIADLFRSPLPAEILIWKKVYTIGRLAFKAVFTIARGPPAAVPDFS